MPVDSRRVEIREVSDDPEARKACMQIRWDVFIVEQKYPPSIEFNTSDDECAHFLLSVDGEPAGTCRVFKSGDKGGLVRSLSLEG